MAVKYEVWADFCVVLVKYLGTVRTEHIVEAYRSYLGSSQYDPAHNHLLDLSGAQDLQIDFAKMLSLIQQIGTMDEMRSKSAKTAIFAPTDGQFGTARMYEMLANQRLPFSVTVARSTKEALGELGLSPADLEERWDAVTDAP